MTSSDPLPLIPDSDDSSVPVYSCQIILSQPDADQQIVGRVANLGGISVSGATERDVLMQITKIFRAQVTTLREEKMPIPWIDPPEEPGPGESVRFLPIHL